MKTRILKGLIFLIVMTLFLISTSGIWAQASGTGTSLIPPEVIDENELFGGPKDIVTVIDPSVASAGTCLLYTSPSPRDRTRSRMPSSA